MQMIVNLKIVMEEVCFVKTTLVAKIINLLIAVIYVIDFKGRLKC